MRYTMKHNFWSLAGNFTIQDECGEDVFFGRKKFFSWADKTSLQDKSGEEQAFIERGAASFWKAYEIHLRGARRARVKRKSSFLSRHFVVEVLDSEDYEVQGNFFDTRLELIRGGRTVATLKKSNLSTNSNIEIAPDEDELLILAIATAIDGYIYSENV